MNTKINKRLLKDKFGFDDEDDEDGDRTERKYAKAMPAYSA
jgi:hypothetical protein